MAGLRIRSEALGLARRGDVDVILRNADRGRPLPGRVGVPGKLLRLVHFLSGAQAPRGR